MKRRSDLAGALAFVAALASPLAAQAYCRTANCPTHTGAWQVCVPANDDDCGTLLFWANRCVGFTLQKDASAQVTLAEAETTFKAAFDTWMNADCGSGKHPSVTVNYQGTVDCHVQEYNKDKDLGNANVIMFRDDTWPYEGTANILALTTVTYNLDTSEIYDADMEINSADIKTFTTGDANVQYDLLSVATHETGHFLGLAHSHNGDATMFTDYKQGSVSLRDLTDDDVSGICATYPPDKPASSDCDDTPRHGFSAKCGADQTPGEAQKGCSVAGAPGGAQGGAGAAGIAAVAALAMLRKRRRR
ncbi:MAG: matrixin family metalloprotease [Polyangiaceae bacterium]